MKVDFTNQTLTSCGRNGLFQTAGIQVDTHAPGQNNRLHYLELAGINSRGQVAIGHLAVPISDAAGLIKSLQQALHAYHEQHGTSYGYEPEVVLPNRPEGRVIVELPCGREVHVHRDNDNIGTIIDVREGPNAEEQGATVTLLDSDNEQGEEEVITDEAAK